MKWINKISSLHVKVPQKDPGILLNFYTELAFELDQGLLFFFLHIKFTLFQTKNLQSPGSCISGRTWDLSHRAITR